MIKKFRKKPVVIEAVQWDGTEQCLKDVALPFLLDSHNDFSHLPDDGEQKGGPGIGYTPPDGQLMIPTLEGNMVASPGDFIIKGIKGEFYPCKPDIFEATYEEVRGFVCEECEQVFEDEGEFISHSHQDSECSEVIIHERVKSNLNISKEVS